MNRVTALWGLLLCWAVWIVAFRDYSSGQLKTAILICCIVGTVINTLNWQPQPKASRDQVTWVMRVAANYALPFAVSMTTQVLKLAE